MKLSFLGYLFSLKIRFPKTAFMLSLRKDGALQILLEIRTVPNCKSTGHTSLFPLKPVG